MHISTLPSTFYTSIPAATFDIQNPLVKPISRNTIGISLQFINDSYARGCLLVAHDAIANEDSFFVLKRHGSNQTMFETVVVSAGNYKVYVYDLEDTLLPNSHPANIAPQVLKVNGSCKFPNMQHVVDVFSCAIEDINAFFSKHTDLQPEIPSNPENLAIVQNGSNVTINCERIVSNTSYILLYRVYGDLTLNVLKVSTVPVAMSLEIGSYTFAVFRMTVIAGIEEKPFLRKKIQVTDTDSKMATPTSILSGNNSAHLLLISFATMYS